MKIDKNHQFNGFDLSSFDGVYLSGEISEDKLELLSPKRRRMTGYNPIDHIIVL